LCRPLTPPSAPPPPEGSGPRAGPPVAPTPYDPEVAQADRGLGRVIDWLRQAGVLDETLVVFTADHGESLGEHGEPTHGIFIYDATIHVPLVWRLPRALPAGTTYRGPLPHVDIVPTR